MGSKKLKHSFATKEENGKNICDVSEVAKILLNWGDIPLKLNNTRAMELSILAQTFLHYETIVKNLEQK